MRQLTGLNWLLIHLMYDTGLHVMQRVRLRMLDPDSEYSNVLVRYGKGKQIKIATDKASITMHVSRLRCTIRLLLISRMPGRTFVQSGIC